MITLPEKNSDEGAEARLLLAECPGPGHPSYTLDKATGAMQLMDAVLRNRLLNPGPFLAKGAKTLRDIIKAKGQFAGFEGYPSYNNGIRQNIQRYLFTLPQCRREAQLGRWAATASRALACQPEGTSAGSRLGGVVLSIQAMTAPCR